MIKASTTASREMFSSIAEHTAGKRSKLRFATLY
jgi:hypothetical protein